MRLFFFLLISLTHHFANAQEVKYLARSPKGLLMGNAFTASVDDEYYLFYNPASLGRGDLFYLVPINPTVAATNALDELDRFDNFPKDAAGISDRILGLPVYLHLSAVPGFKFGPFGFSLIASSSTSAILRNASHPTLDIDYRYDRGFVLGFAYSGGNKTRAKKKDGGSMRGAQWSLGASIKHINRQGLKDSFPLFGSTLLDIIENRESSEFSDIRNELGYSKGDAWGLDLGGEYSYYSGNSRLTFSLAVLDTFDTQFDLSEGQRPLPDQQMVVASGVSWGQDFKLAHYSLNAELTPLNQHIDWRRKLHLGLELGIPVVSLLAGVNEGYLSYGLSVNFWLIKIVAGFYSVELGSSFQQEKSSRAIFSLNLLDLSFNM